ncbi:helix-turn-helix domain-containing protein [Raineyella sp. W15-4]|uniref:helix-turn-helix domain-containing protein n=1 Tax=Raineyella sp. W15-4 TaxID=3081651 RepID=UPI002954FDE3|nr:helix-turn-helix domain-containing protein [Raineyella sp. W15-4]WOQ17794.1 helix-turn-helix domain-containing protein [Raineyella sp. W15-4]
MEIRDVTLGERIAEGRGLRGLTQDRLAHAADLSRTAIAKIESGTRRVSALELVAIAQALNFRLDWFTNASPPAMVSHRNLSEPGAPSPSIDLALEMLVRDVEFVASQIQRSRPAPPSPLDAPAHAQQADDVAATARGLLGLPADEPVHDLQHLVASLGLLAFSLDLGQEGADAATILLPDGGVSLINGDRSVGRRRLALAHELCHYLVADDYRIDWQVAVANDADTREAAFDRFARALLLPGTGLESTWRDHRGEGLRLAAVLTGSRFQVDMTTLARRLRELDLIGSEESTAIRAVRTTKGDIVEWGLHVPHDLEPPALPIAYQQDVLRLYERELISEDRALDLLYGAYGDDDLPPLAPGKISEI